MRNGKEIRSTDNIPFNMRTRLSGGRFYSTQFTLGFEDTVPPKDRAGLYTVQVVYKGENKTLIANNITVLGE